jgi:PncC family amidohydrolase
VVIMNRGAVSAECAEAMATGLRERSGADITLSVTGIAGPDGGTAAKPVGTVHFGLATARGVEVDSRRFAGSRDWIRERAAAHGLWLLWRAARGLGR